MLKKRKSNDCQCDTSITGDISIINVTNKTSDARISEQGAQLLEWIPKGHEGVIWLSTKTAYKKNTPIRGGIPICWPWFGSHPITSEYPSHGFARRKNWILRQCNSTGQETTLAFEIQNEDLTCWPYPCAAILRYIIGKKLTIKLTTINLSQTASLSYTQALHTYFQVSSLKNIEILGLEQAQYYDKLNSYKLDTQHDILTIKNKIDRIYSGVTSPVVLSDKGFKRRITIEHEGANAIVIWNPGKEKASRMKDMGPQNAYDKMICIETATAGKNVVTIPPLGNHTISSTYSLSKL